MSATEVFKKSNSMLVMVPATGKITPVARKLYNSLLKITQQKALQMNQDGTKVDATLLFSVPLSTLVSNVSSGSSDLRTVAQKYLREMRRIELNWEAPDANTGVVWRNMNMLSEVALELKDGSLWVSWQLPPTLLSEVIDPSRYTPLDLTNMEGLKSYAAVALYEIGTRYRNNPNGVTSRARVEWWIDALSPSGPGLDGKARREWRKFKHQSLSNALDEINSKTDLRVQLLEFKEGRAITEAQFTVERQASKTPEQVGKIEKVEIQLELAQQAIEAGLSLKTVEQQIKKGHTQESISVAVAQVKARKAREDLEPISKPHAYFSKVLANGPAISPIPEQVNKPIPIAAVIQRAERVDPIEPESVETLRRKQITKEIKQLDPLLRQELLQKATEQLRTGKILTPSISRALMSGDWERGVILTKVQDIYATELFGQDWKSTNEWFIPDRQ